MQRNHSDHSWSALIQQQLNYLGAAFEAAHRQWRGATECGFKGRWLQGDEHWLSAQSQNDASRRLLKST